MGTYPGVKMKQNEIETLKDAKAYVYQNEDSIKRIIAPSDLVHQNVDNWDNVDKDLLREELGMSMGDVWTYGINHPYGNLIEDMAIVLFIDDMPKIRFDHLVFDTVKECVKNGYWPYGSELGDKNPNKWDMQNIVYEVKSDIEYFHEYETEVQQEIEASIIEARLKDF